MKGTDIFIALFLFVLCLFSGVILAFSFSTTNQVINGFYSNLDEQGFWLNPGNSNISILKEEDVYKGIVTYPAQSSDTQMKLGINQAANGYYEVNVNRKYQRDSIFIVKTTNATTGEIEMNPATFDDFIEALKKISQDSVSQRMDICVSKSIDQAGNNYDHFCGILIYEN